MASNESQERQILAALLNGQRLTGQHALFSFGSSRLAARIYALRTNPRYGAPEIASGFIVTQSGKRVKQYWMEAGSRAKFIQA